MTLLGIAVGCLIVCPPSRLGGATRPARPQPPGGMCATFGVSALDRRGRAEATSIALGADAERAPKDDPHRLGTAEPACGGDVLDASARLLEQPPGGLHAGALDESPR